MELRAYLNSLPVAQQIEFAKRCGTTIGSLRQALATRNGQVSAATAVEIERHSGRKVRAETTCRKVDWSFIRNTSN